MTHINFLKFSPFLLHLYSSSEERSAKRHRSNICIQSANKKNELIRVSVISNDVRIQNRQNV